MDDFEQILMAHLRDNIEQQLSAIPRHDSQRLFHGRGFCYEGFDYLTIDWFNPVVLGTLYKGFLDNREADFLSHFVESLPAILLPLFEDYFPEQQLEAIVLQSRMESVASSELIYGSLPENSVALESGLHFQLDFENKQNVGFFLDMRNARQWLASECEQKKVLNLFAFTCAFSVVALANQASSVVNLDMGQGVLRRGEKNHYLNKLDMRTVSFIKSDVFKAWKKLHKYGRYDIVIIDPPSFQRGSFDAEKDYPKIVQKLHKLLAPEATILACLNSPFLTEAFLDATFLQSHLNEGEHQLEKIKRIANPSSFCESNLDAGLKVVVYQYRRSPKLIPNAEDSRQSPVV
jgi:23S rRNA (cytosine1962-C5)-methyltransferase